MKKLIIFILCFISSISFSNGVFASSSNNRQERASEFAKESLKYFENYKKDNRNNRETTRINEVRQPQESLNELLRIARIVGIK